MKYEAVIFDLFRTLVDNFSAREYESVLMQMASVLAVPYDDLARLWFDTSNERTTGIFQNTEANIEYICRELRVHAESTRIRLAAQVRFEYVARSMIPRAGAIEVLSYLKSEGYKTGLISDCSALVPTVWKDTPLAQLEVVSQKSLSHV